MGCVEITDLALEHTAYNLTANGRALPCTPATRLSAAIIAICTPARSQHPEKKKRNWA